MSPHRHLTLVLTTILHLFTHAYGVLLVPLYLLIAADLHLSGVKAAALIVTVYGLVYNVPSFNAGVLADKHDRKWLLGLGLLGNAIAIMLMGCTHQYALLLVLAAMGGLFGTIFHPTANSLIPAHYPRNPGMAIGLLGVGSGLGFYIGPKFTGWRAETAHWGHFAAWQRPLVEMGAAGIVCALLYLIFAREAKTHQATRVRQPLGSVLRKRTFLIAATLGWRDCAGVAAFSLIAIYLQKARGFDVRATGAIVGTMMLLSVIVNPLLVYLTPGNRRLPALASLLVIAGAILAATPFISGGWIVGILIAFQSLHLGTYAVGDAAMLERVPDALRGRVVGLFFLCAGTASGAAPWAIGWWTDVLGRRAADPMAYVPIFATCGAVLAVSAVSIPLIAKLGEVQGTKVEPISETMPGTIEVLG